jgi:hypothetical protein
MSEPTWKMKPTSGNGEWELPPAGNMGAVCIALIDLGTQRDSYMGKPKDAHQLVIVWELPGMVSTKTGKNFLVCEKFNASLHPKASLRKTLGSWRGAPVKEDEEFDLYKIVGAVCLLQVSHDKTNSGNDVYSIDAVTGLPKGMPRPVATFPLVKFKLDDGPEAIPAQDWLPLMYGKKIPDVVRSCIEFRTREEAPAPPDADESPPVQEADIPF